MLLSGKSAAGDGAVSRKGASAGGAAATWKEADPKATSADPMPQAASNSRISPIWRLFRPKPPRLAYRKVP